MPMRQTSKARHLEMAHSERVSHVLQDGFDVQVAILVQVAERRAQIAIMQLVRKLNLRQYKLGTRLVPKIQIWPWVIAVQQTCFQLQFPQRMKSFLVHKESRY